MWTSISEAAHAMQHENLEKKKKKKRKKKHCAATSFWSGGTEASQI
jgi:hypothetical protein